MSLDLTLVGQDFPVVTHTWDFRDAIVYALGVGAGVADPHAELALTTQNSTGVTHRVLPTFAVLKDGRIDYSRLGNLPLEKILHAEQSVEVFGALPTDATVEATSWIESVYDKGKAALITTGTRLHSESGERLAETYSTIFVRDAGGFGGERGPKSDWVRPERDPDAVLSFTTRPDQALLYRLSGDYNPLHSDPEFAEKAGFEQPILHGLCSYGIAGRLLLEEICGGDVARFGKFSARFASPVLPGQTLDFPVWHTDTGAVFQGLVGNRLVLDGGVLTLRTAP